jgi:hypothetical protein
MKNTCNLYLFTVIVCCFSLSFTQAQPHKGDWLIDGTASTGTGDFNFFSPFTGIHFVVKPNGGYFISNRLAAMMTRSYFGVYYSENEPSYFYLMDLGLRYYYGKKTARFAPFFGASHQFRENRPLLYLGANYYLAKDFALEFNLGTYEIGGYPIGNFGFKTVISKRDKSTIPPAMDSSWLHKLKVNKGDVLFGLNTELGRDKHRLGIDGKFGIMATPKMMLGVASTLLFWEDRTPVNKKTTSIDLALGGFVRFYPFHNYAQNIFFLETSIQQVLTYSITDEDYTRYFDSVDRVFSDTRWTVAQTIGINRFISSHVALEGGLTVGWPHWFEATPNVNINLGLQVFLHPCNCQN